MSRGPRPHPKPSEKATPALRPPKGLRPEAVAEWKRVVKLLAKQRVLGELDIAALTIYATSFADYREAQQRIDQNGTVVEGPTGQPMKNPYMAVLKESWDRIRVLLPEFGLTPSARARLKIEHDSAEKSDEIVF